MMHSYINYFNHQWVPNVYIKLTKIKKPCTKIRMNSPHMMIRTKQILKTNERSPYLYE